MQNDSMQFSNSGHLKQANNQDSPVWSIQCGHCTQTFKSKVFLFDHLNQGHGFDVDTSLRYAGLKYAETTKNISSSGTFKCQHCDFKACSRDVLHEHEKRCDSKNPNVIGTLIIAENPETQIIANQRNEAAGAREIPSVLSVTSTSKAKCSLNSLKDLKTYKRPQETISKYFAPTSESNGKPPAKSADGNKGTLILQESPSSSSPNSSGVFQVTAKSVIDIPKVASNFDHLLIPDLRPPKSREQTAPSNISKRTNNGSTESRPAKTVKLDKETELPQKENANKQPPSNTEFSFEVSEDEEDKKVRLVNGDTESPKVIFCKHCDHSDVDIRCMSTHYQGNHPYIRYTAAYIQDSNDQSATFRCLECPVEFLNTADLKRHYVENHPEAPDVFTMKSSGHSLVFKCFVCPFTTNVLMALKEHYKEKHPTHEADNSFFNCRYSVPGCQKESSQQNKCEKLPSPEETGGMSVESAQTPCKEVKNITPTQHPASEGPHVALYKCNNCMFSSKSVVVMHVHYQKSHPDEAVTIDKIKQLARVAPQMTPEKTPNSGTVIENVTHPKSISCPSKKEDKAEPSQQKNILLFLNNSKQTPEDATNYQESPKTEKVESLEDKCNTKALAGKQRREKSTGMYSLLSSVPDQMFYCQFCSYTNTNIKSVVGHHNAKHAMHAPIGMEDIICYSAEMQKNKLQSEAKTSQTSPSPHSKSSKQVEVRSETAVQCEERDAADASKTRTDAYACAENLFFCQRCNFANPNVKGVVNHQAKTHHGIITNIECVVEHTALIRDEIKNSKCHANNFSFSTNLPLPLLNKGDEDLFFCHICNYRHSAVSGVMRHLSKTHRGHAVKASQIHIYTSMVLKQTKKLHLETSIKQEVNQEPLRKMETKKKKTRKLAKSVSASVLSTSSSSPTPSPSSGTSQTERTLQCYKCSFSSQILYGLKRHIREAHGVKRSVTDLLRLCFKQGVLQSGYHCEMCLFTHEKAAAVCKHYREQHPDLNSSLEYVSTRLFVGDNTFTPKKKKAKLKHTDGVSDGDGTARSLTLQRWGQNKSKMYSCRKCSFKGNSMSSIARHYRAVHHVSAKKDSLDLFKSKKESATSQVEDHEEMPRLFDTFQVPLDCDESSDERTVSSKKFKCPYCPAGFNSQRGRNTHCGMKHQKDVNENSEEQQKEQEESKNHVHVFKCPYCTYVNSIHQGVLTHCQMKHAALPSRADSFHVDMERNWEDHWKRKGPGDVMKLVGYMCEHCPQICVTLDKLNKHCVQDHNDTVTSNPAAKPSAVSKMKASKAHSAHASVAKASFLSNKKYALLRCQHCSFRCTTKIALTRHLRVIHKSGVSKDSLYKCLVCSKAYFRKKHLAIHYAKKHGKGAYLKYYVAMFKQVPEKPAPTSADAPLTQQPQNSSESSKSSITTEEMKILVYNCPSCQYVNASYHGTLTHCQMKHPTLVARADVLQTTEIPETNMVRCTMGRNSNASGYICKKCPQIHASLKKLKTHCHKEHMETVVFEHSAETEAENQPIHNSPGSVANTASLEKTTSKVSIAETGQSPESGSPETSSSSLSSQGKGTLYKCRMCSYKGLYRKYLHCHYRNTHKMDALSTYKLLENYNQRKYRGHKLQEVQSEQSASVKCKKCTDLMFVSPQLLIDHYSTFHRSDCKLDFTVLSLGKKKESTGRYKCSHCMTQLYGIRKLCHHLDHHRAREEEAVKKKASSVPEPEPVQLYKDEMPMFESVEEMTQWSIKPVPSSLLSSPSKLTDVEQPELESKDDKRTCEQCGRTFMSLKGLRSHERSHAAMAAIKKLDKLPPSALKEKTNKYVIHKPGTMRPFVCRICSYRTPVLALFGSHLMKKHQDVLMDSADTDNKDDESAQRADKEPPYSSDDVNSLAELDEEPELTGKLLYSEPPDVQRQLNHYSLMSQRSTKSRANVQDRKLTYNSLLHCEFCNFNTEHLSSIRRHYLNRHGKKVLRCKDCDFFTGLRKTLVMHMQSGHSTCQSQSTHQRDLRCPFCLYQTKNKNNMIDHIVLHREERVVPIEVCRPKLSRYLQGLVFRCHKCTFTSGCVENLRLHMTRHDDIKPYRCRLCYFDCTQLSDLEAHLSDKHQVVRNHELVGQVILDQLQTRIDRIPEKEEEPSSNLERQSNNSEDEETEEFYTDCDEAPDAENPAENTNREKMALQITEEHRKQGQDEAEDRGPGLGSVEQNTGEGNLADIQLKDRSGPEEERQTKDTEAQPKPSSITNTPPKEKAAEGSSKAYFKITDKAKLHKLHIKEVEHRNLNIEARVEDSIIRRILQLDEDGSIHRKYKKTGQERTVKIERSIEAEGADNDLRDILFQDEENSIPLAQDSKTQVNIQAIPTLAKINHSQANDGTAQESLTAQRHLLTLSPNCAQLKLKHEDSSGVSIVKCKQEPVHGEKNCEAETESYGEMPVLENEYLKEEMHRLGCCKEEEDDHLEQTQDQKVEMIKEDTENRCNDLDSPHGHKGAFRALDGAAEALHSSLTEEKRYTCELCGRNLVNSSDLKRHIMRHGI
ncbi:zinc finger protein 462-like isoform X1 [Embiotoca jacksoni]|uniref:zinc finger protein 462-like isoform X1 n=1 Tax=Embiotoca jacksoni TaxID=100190 RepID=UPI003704C71F